MMEKLEVIGTIVGLLYIYLEYKASVWVWLTGIVMPAIYIFVYYDSGFYADMGINVYYLIAGMYGWSMWMGRKLWKRGTAEDAEPLKISRTPKKYVFPLTAVVAVSFAVIVWILLTFTDSDVPYGDSLTTALSIVGLWMLARKYVEQWIVWIVVDLLCFGLYMYKGLYPTAILYGLYSVIAVFGYFKWIRLMRAQ